MSGISFRNQRSRLLEVQCTVSTLSDDLGRQVSSVGIDALSLRSKVICNVFEDFFYF